MPDAACITIVDEGAGFDDRSILDFAHYGVLWLVNRVGDKPGLELEDHRERWQAERPPGCASTCLPEAS